MHGGEARATVIRVWGRHEQICELELVDVDCGDDDDVLEGAC